MGTGAGQVAMSWASASRRDNCERCILHGQTFVCGCTASFRWCRPGTAATHMSIWTSESPFGGLSAEGRSSSNEPIPPMRNIWCVERGRGRSLGPVLFEHT